MASTYNFLGLVNDVCRRLNEEPLITSNFSGATGFYSATKEFVNSAIRDINQLEYNWPFNHTSTELELEAGVNKYNMPAEAKVVDFDSFRLVKDTVLNVSPRKLKQIQYNDYLTNWINEEYKDADQGSLPQYVFMTQGAEFGVVPMPNEDYTIEFEYFVFPADLVAGTDVPSIPERFRHVIVEGAMYYAYMFRDNPQSAQLARANFEDKLKAMRSILTNEYISVIDTRSRNINVIYGYGAF